MDTIQEGVESQYPYTNLLGELSGSSGINMNLDLGLNTGVF